MKMGSVGDSLFAGAPSSSPHEVFAQTGTNSLSWKKGARINFVAVLPDSPRSWKKQLVDAAHQLFFSQEPFLLDATLIQPQEKTHENSDLTNLHCKYNGFVNS
jgi:hypothetical protein